MALNFPANPAGQTPVNTYSPSSTPDSTTNGATYIWNGTAWTGSVDGVGVSIVSAASFPATATPNDLLFNTENGKLYIYYQDVDSNQWVDTSADSTSSLVVISENPPANPTQGELWWDSSTDGGVLYIYYVDADSNQWVEVGGSSGGGGGDATVESGSVPPEDPKVNTLWFNDVTGRLYIYYQDADGSQWVDTDVGGTTEQMPTGGGQNRIFYENQQTVTDNYTLDGGTNAMSAGPVTVNNGISVTVPAGQTWTVVGGASGGGGGGDSGFWQRSGTTLSPATTGDNVSTTGSVSGAGATFTSTGTFGSFDSAQTTANGARIGSEGQITSQRSSATATSAAIDILSGSTATFAVLGTGETRIGGNVAGAASNITLNADGSASFLGGTTRIPTSGSLLVGNVSSASDDTGAVVSNPNGSFSAYSNIYDSSTLAFGTATSAFEIVSKDTTVDATRVTKAQWRTDGSLRLGTDLSGSSTAGNTFLYADGSITAAGRVTTGGLTSNEGSILCDRSNPDDVTFLSRENGTSRARIQADGTMMIGGSLTGSSLAPNISLNVDGSGIFQSYLGCRAPDATPGSVAQIWRESAGGTELGRLTGDSAFRLGNTGTTFRVALFGDSGNADFTGSVSKGSGSFRIDHPLPAKKDTHHLVHSFIEGPQADNIYRGEATLVNGTATVDLDVAGRMTPGTFVLLNTNVSCFTSNETDWTPVRGSVSGNTLTIEAQDNTSTASVHWLVIGERHDQHMIDTDWTDENGRVITEPLKAN